MISALQPSIPTPVGRSGPSPAPTPREVAEAPRPQPEPRRDPGAPLQGLSRPLVSAQNLVQAQKASGETTRTDSGSDLQLSDEDKAAVRDLQTRDREVRAHEQAHASVGGQYAGSPSYELERGPDGRSYAVGGHVSISTSPVPNDPQATIDKMDQVKRAALAPVEPSGQDRRVAADAEGKRAKAQAELMSIKQDELRSPDGEDPSGPNAEIDSNGITLKDGLRGFADALKRADDTGLSRQAAADVNAGQGVSTERDPLSPGIDLVA